MIEKLEVLKKIIMVVEPGATITIELGTDYSRVVVKQRNCWETVNYCEDTLELAVHKALKSMFDKLDAWISLKQGDLSKAIAIKMQASEYVAK